MTRRRHVYLAAVVAGVLAGSLWWSALFLVLAWAVMAYLMPMAPCRRCKGAKVNAASRWLGHGGRHGPCRRCGGSGSRWALGARQVHRLVQQIRSKRKGGWR